MFYAPKTVASMVAAEQPYDLYSDLHKDAIGCRPGAAQGRLYDRMGGVERAVEHKRLGEWMAEADRIDELRAEVARFDFSRGMEYLMRREGLTRLEAFEMQIRRCKQRPYPNDHLPSWDECLEEAQHYGWDFLAMDCGLPQSDGARLKEWWEELSAE